MIVKLLGTSGNKPLPDRPLTSLYVKKNTTRILVDAGEGFQITNLDKAGETMFNLDLMCFTHGHSDHWLGFIGILSSMAGRTKPLYVMYPADMSDIISFNLRFCPPGFEIVKLPITSRKVVFEIDSIVVEAFKVVHSLDTYGYKFSTTIMGTLDRDKASNSPLTEEYWRLLQNGLEVTSIRKVFAPDHIFGEAKTLSVVYSTDTRPCELLQEACKGATLAILEGMYPSASHMNKAIENKHMLMTEAATVAKDAGVQELWLTHYSALVVDPARHETAVKSIFSNSVLSAVGVCAELCIDKETREPKLRDKVFY